MWFSSQERAENCSNFGTKKSPKYKSIYARLSNELRKKIVFWNIFHNIELLKGIMGSENLWGKWKFVRQAKFGYTQQLGSEVFS